LGAVRVNVLRHSMPSAALVGSEVGQFSRSPLRVAQARN
jgi:hypothetical protein